MASQAVRAPRHVGEYDRARRRSLGEQPDVGDAQLGAVGEPERLHPLLRLEPVAQPDLVAELVEAPGRVRRVLDGDHQVVALEADDQVVDRDALPERERIGAAADHGADRDGRIVRPRLQFVVIDDVLPGERVEPAFDMDQGQGLARDHHAVVVDGVAAVAAVVGEHVIAGAALDAVVAAAAADHVRPGAGVDHVVAGAAVDQVGADAGRDGVVAAAAHQHVVAEGVEALRDVGEGAVDAVGRDPELVGVAAGHRGARELREAGDRGEAVDLEPARRVPGALCDGEHELVALARHRHVGESGAEALDVEAREEAGDAAVEIGLVERRDAELLGAQQGHDPAGRECGVRVHRDERVDDVLVGEIAAVVLGDLDLARQLLERGGGRVGDGALDVEVAARDIELLERADDGDVDLVLGGGAPRADLVDPVGREHHSLRPAHHRRGLGRPIAGRIEPDLETLIAHHLAADGVEIGVEHLGGGAAQVGDHAGDIAVVAVDRLGGELLVARQQDGAAAGPMRLRLPEQAAEHVAQERAEERADQRADDGADDGDRNAKNDGGGAADCLGDAHRRQDLRDADAADQRCGAQDAQLAADRAADRAAQRGRLDDLMRQVAADEARDAGERIAADAVEKPHVRGDVVDNSVHQSGRPRIDGRAQQLVAERRAVESERRRQLAGQERRDRADGLVAERGGDIAAKIAERRERGLAQRRRRASIAEEIVERLADIAEQRRQGRSRRHLGEDVAAADHLAETRAEDGPDLVAYNDGALWCSCRVPFAEGNTGLDLAAE